MSSKAIIVVIGSITRQQNKKIRAICRDKGKKAVLIPISEDLFPFTDANGVSVLDHDSIASRHGVSEYELLRPDDHSYVDTHELIGEDVENEHEIDPRHVDYVLISTDFAVKFEDDPDFEHLTLVFTLAEVVV